LIIFSCLSTPNNGIIENYENEGFPVLIHYFFGGRYLTLKTFWLLPACVVFGATFANAVTLSFTCDPNIDAAVAGTCNTLNTTIAGIYNSTFTNVNASIYIQYGTTGLGSSTQGFTNQISYDTFLTQLAATGSGSALDVAALASLPTTEPALYNGAKVDISTALGTALGISGLTGTTAGGATCSVGAAGCYNGIITITNDPTTLLYFRNGAQDPNAYDFFSVTEHEIDEVLGTSSCIDTTGGALANNCVGNAPSAVDLFRYNGGSKVLLDPTPGAYFSYDGGVTNGADGAIYNTLADGNDYADFISGCPSMTHIQDGSACPGQGGLDITNDGHAEINILDAIGYNLQPVTAVPEPGTTALIITAALVFGGYRRKRRA
jgi:hypothetical protein